jgi:parallel beta-helix repeat protein
MYLDDSGSNVISNSVIYNNSAGGIHIYSNSNVLNNNSISNNSVSIGDELFGIFIYGANNTNLSNNTISSSVIGLNLRSANNTTVVSDRYFNNSNNSILFNASLINSNMSVNLTSVVFDSPSGALSGYSNISLVDVVVDSSIYSLNWSSSPGTSPTGSTSPSNQYLSISNSTELVSIDSLTFHYVPGDVNQESTLGLWRYSSGSWTEVNATLNTASNLVNASALSSFGTFALFEDEFSPSSSSSSSDRTPSYSVSHDSDCPNSLTLSRGGSVSSDVFVAIVQNGFTIASGRTDSRGRFSYNVSSIDQIYVRLGSSTYFGPYSPSVCRSSETTVQNTTAQNESIPSETQEPQISDSDDSSTPVSSGISTQTNTSTQNSTSPDSRPTNQGSSAGNSQNPSTGSQSTNSSGAAASSQNNGGAAFGLLGVGIVLLLILGAGAYWFFARRR